MLKIKKKIVWRKEKEIIVKIGWVGEYDINENMIEELRDEKLIE